jgi:hypothetical protein
VRDQVSHPYKTTGKIMVLYFNLHISVQHCKSECNRNSWADITVGTMFIFVNIHVDLNFSFRPYCIRHLMRKVKSVEQST